MTELPFYVNVTLNLPHHRTGPVLHRNGGGTGLFRKYSEPAL